MEQEQQKKYGEHPHVSPDLGGPLLRANDKKVLQEMAATIQLSSHQIQITNHCMLWKKTAKLLSDQLALF